jgi:hypothetical protein
MMPKHFRAKIGWATLLVAGHILSSAYAEEALDPEACLGLKSRQETGASLSPEELSYLARCISDAEKNKKEEGGPFSGDIIYPQEQATIKDDEGMK